MLSYNALSARATRSTRRGAAIDVQLKRRHDLVPNLVETVKGYAAHERETLRGVTEARGAAEAADGGPAEAERGRGAG